MQIVVNSRYNNSDDYEYTTRLERIDLDAERRHDVLSGNGFIVSNPKNIKDDIKNPYGIFSDKFGPGLHDANAFGDRYRCRCGRLKSKLNNNEICPVCGTRVEYKDDNFSFFGWGTLKDPYYIIHPNLFMAIAFFIGEKDFNNIIKYVDKKDEDGHDTEIKRPKDEPFYGIGMMDFHDRFDEIMQYYYNKKPNKRDYYEDIMKNRDKVFTQSVPVFTTCLRPYKLDGGVLHYESTNATYNIIINDIEKVNNDRIEINRKRKPKNESLYEIQTKYKELYDEIVKILSGKKGTIQLLFGGRYNYTARSVIAPGPNLRIDEVHLSYPCLCGLLQQVIINILHKSYRMNYNEAYKLLNESMHEENPLIRQIIEGIIKSNRNGRGIPVLINRNPTISLGGIIAMYCTGISTGYTMLVPLEILEGLAADFDGDT